MAEAKRLSLTFFMSSPLHRETWKILQKIPAGMRMETICVALCRDRDRKMVLDMVRKELQKETAQPARHEQTVQPERVEDEDQNVLDFLRSLQEDGGDDA